MGIVVIGSLTAWVQSGNNVERAIEIDNKTESEQVRGRVSILTAHP